MGSKKKKILGQTTDEVGRAAIDYFSWGHIGMGIVAFLLLSLINTVPSYVTHMLIYIIPYYIMILLVIIIAIVWELLENTLLLEWGFKFEGRQDSLENATWDIIFVVIGGLVMWIFKGLIVNIWGNSNNTIQQAIIYFYIIGIISFGVIIVCFLIGKQMTKEKTKKMKKKK
ncbi:MAG: MFS transporter [Promethearchaeota archaeon]